MRYYITILLFILCVLINAQVKIQGKVIDAETLEPIAYADIRLPELKINATSNSDGTFYIESAVNTDKLTISKNGYEFSNYVIEKKNRL